eukprot:TRINITY_DN4874_c1_g1_i1.p1 TRINITY_DN4874_c1_g1~~TRINITY_DN4874_c1_g1_i1.p1  ORF type:complete len:173 (+),score=68.68 TRINITY_DN4874_c1_g1_i1:51-569(+)
MLRGVCRSMCRAGARAAPTMMARPAMPTAAPAPVFTARRYCSADPDREEIMNEMKSDIKSSKVCLFMKGEPEQPRCGFSARTVDLLGQYGVAYTSYNVLAHPVVREGIKEISGWPTIPQVFVAGEFVGGCDLMMEMHESGDLVDLFQSNDVPFRNPKTGATFGGPTQGTDGQ